MSLATLKFGFTRVVDGEMLCCTTERAEQITNAVNTHTELVKRVKDLEEALRSTLKRCKMIELPQNYEILHGKADSLLQK